MSAIVGAIVTSVVLFPIVGAWSVLLAPLGGSCAAVAAGLLGAAMQDRRLAAEPDVDHMVASLHGVLHDAERAETASAASHAAGQTADQPAHRNAG